MNQFILCMLGVALWPLAWRTVKAMEWLAKTVYETLKDPTPEDKRDYREMALVAGCTLLVSSVLIAPYLLGIRI